MKVIKGREFFLELLKIANKKAYKVFLLGSTKGVLKNSIDVLSVRYPSVHIESSVGARLNENAVPVSLKQRKLDTKVRGEIKKFKPKMLFVAFGAPKQEKWVYRYLKSLNTDLVMVVGGSLDYVSGTRVAVPKYIEKSGLEWFWRLITGSQKLDRVINAIIKFPLLIINDVS